MFQIDSELELNGIIEKRHGANCKLKSSFPLNLFRLSLF